MLQCIWNRKSLTFFTSEDATTKKNIDLQDRKEELQGKPSQKGHERSGNTYTTPSCIWPRKLVKLVKIALFWTSLKKKKKNHTHTHTQT